MPDNAQDVIGQRVDGSGYKTHIITTMNEGNGASAKLDISMGLPIIVQGQSQFGVEAEYQSLNMLLWGY